MSTQTIAIHLPDGAIREVPSGTTPLEIANSISPRLAAACVVARLTPVASPPVTMIALFSPKAFLTTWISPSPGWSVGASGAIFGLFGVILISTRFHHAILDAQSRSIAGQIGLLIVINLAIGFSGVLNVDNYAHVGGLIAGMWLGVVLPPSRVQTLASAWQAPRVVRSPAQALTLRVIGVAALVAVVGGIIAYGTVTWQANNLYQQYWAAPAAAPAVRVVALEWAPGPAIELIDAR